MNQIKIHNRIDKFVTADIANADVSVAQEFVAFNFDARDYFFEKLDQSWIDWLDENSFFDVLNESPDDLTRYSFKMPELGFLERVASKEAEKVTKIILKVDLVQNFNPEVIDRFTRIAEDLKGENLKLVVQKMHDENWVSLMQKFNTWGFSYEKIVENLIAEKNID